MYKRKSAEENLTKDIITKKSAIQKIKNYRRITKNISKKSKEKLTKDFIKIPKEKTYNTNNWYFYQLFCVYILGKSYNVNSILVCTIQIGMHINEVIK